MDMLRSLTGRTPPKTGPDIVVDGTGDEESQDGGQGAGVPVSDVGDFDSVRSVFQDPNAQADLKKQNEERLSRESVQRVRDHWESMRQAKELQERNDFEAAQKAQRDEDFRVYLESQGNLLGVPQSGPEVTHESLKDKTRSLLEQGAAGAVGGAQGHLGSLADQIPLGAAAADGSMSLDHDKELQHMKNQIRSLKGQVTKTWNLMAEKKDDRVFMDGIHRKFDSSIEAYQRVLLSLLKIPILTAAEREAFIAEFNSEEGRVNFAKEKATEQMSYLDQLHAQTPVFDGSQGVKQKQGRKGKKNKKKTHFSDGDQAPARLVFLATRQDNTRL